MWSLLYGANILREHFKGNRVNLCSLINARSGNCSEDCKFCAQSAHHSAEVKTYPLVPASEIRQAYYRTQEIGANGFSIVTSGNELSDEEIGDICDAASKIRNSPRWESGLRLSCKGFAPQSATVNSQLAPYLCGSLGRLTQETANKLKVAGFTKCHHNLETSRSFFPRVCTTHTYDERIETIKNIKASGLKVCCGGIFGLGETWSDRIEMALTLRELEIDSVPLNFLIPVKGTVLQDQPQLTPIEALKIIAFFRYLLPDMDIKVCGGREKVLNNLQSWIFFAGANGMMVGGYLTQPGRSVTEDFQMIKALGLYSRIDDA